MGLTPEQKKRFESLAQRLHIEFNENSQLNHAEFGHHNKKSILGQTIAFLEDVNDFEHQEYLTADWQNIIPIRQRKANTIRAKKLVSKAMGLKLDPSKVSTSSAPKESTWRFKTEIPIFERLEDTITCKTCAKRLWKALFESPFPPDDDGDLERRQARREYCKCTAEDMPDDYDLDHTMGIIIKDYIEPRIVHPRLLRVAIDKDLEPDYVAGLQRHRFNQCMEKPLVKAQLQNQPTGEDNMIFPFMVAEAKKEDGDAWDYTIFQTVFPIYTMLSVQWRLLSANAANGHKLSFDPIVWFYAYRGHFWKLHLAYLDKSRDVTRNFQVLEDETAIPNDRLTSKQIPYPVKIVRVWEGDLTDENKALQLLLIVDHMADWARDYYREVVKKGLQNLHGYSYPGLERIDSQKTDILSKINTRTSGTSMDSDCGKLGIDEDGIQCSVNDLIPASIPGYPSRRVLFGDESIPPLTVASSPSNAFPCSRDIQMPGQPQLRQLIGDLFPAMPYQGISQSLSESQTPIYDASLAPGNIFLSKGITYPGSSHIVPEPLLSKGIPYPGSSSHVAPEPLLLPFNSSLYFSAGNPCLGVPQLAYQPQPSQPLDSCFLPEDSLFQIAPQITQQPQPLYVSDEFSSAGSQYFGASQAFQQSQPQTYPTTGPQLDLPVRVRPTRTPSSQNKKYGSNRTRSQSPRMRNAARQSRGGALQHASSSEQSP